MDYRSLGNTGMMVSPLCLGAMMFGQWGEPDHDTSVGIIHRALDAGINFVDTADVYSRGESEEIVGKALKGRRGDVVLATKFHGPMDVDMGQTGDPLKRGNSRRWIVQEVENSLRRLQTDWIDLYQVHRPEQETDVEETLSALTDLQRAGKIRAFGCSTFPAHAVVESQWVSERARPGPLRHRAAAVLAAGARRRGRPAAGRRAVRHGRAALEPAERRLAHRTLPQGPGRPRDAPRQAALEPVRPLQPGEPGQAGRRRGARAARRGARPDAGAPRARLRAAAPRRHLADRRPAHDGAARDPARRGRRDAHARGARPDRRDRPARGQPRLVATPATSRRRSPTRSCAGVAPPEQALRPQPDSPSSAADFSRISTLRILPVTVIGNSSTVIT